MHISQPSIVYTIDAVSMCEHEYVIELERYKLYSAMIFTPDRISFRWANLNWNGESMTEYADVLCGNGEQGNAMRNEYKIRNELMWSDIYAIIYAECN